MKSLLRHKKILYALICVALTFSLLGFFFVQKGADQSTKSDKDTKQVSLDISGKGVGQGADIQEVTDFYEINVSIPELSSSDSLHKEEINTSLRALAEKSINEFKISAVSSKKIDDMKSTLDAGYRKICSLKTCTIIFSQSIYYSGSAHPYTTIITKTFEKESGKIMSLSDVFLTNDTFYNTVSDAVMVQAKSILLNHHEGERDYVPDVEWIRDGLKNKDEAFAQFSLSDEFLTFYFEEYQLAPRVESLTEVTIPRTLIQNFTK